MTALDPAIAILRARWAGAIERGDDRLAERLRQLLDQLLNEADR